MKYIVIIILFFALKSEAQLIQYKPAQSIQEIDEQTDSILSANNHKSYRLDGEKKFRVKLLTERSNREYPFKSTQHISELLELRKLQEISDAQLVEKFRNLNELERGIYLRNAIIRSNSWINKDIDGHQMLLKYALDLAKQDNRFYRYNRNEILDLSLKKAYFPNLYKESLELFWETKKDSLNYSDWMYFHKALVPPINAIEKQIIDKVLDIKIDSIIYDRLGVYRINTLYKYSERYNPNEIYNDLQIEKRVLDECLVISDTLKYSFLTFQSTLESRNFYDFDYNKFSLDKENIVTINEFPYNGVDFIRAQEFLRQLNLGFNLYTSDALGEFPVDYRWEQEKGFEPILKRLGIDILLEYDYDYIYDKENKPIKELYKLFLIFQGKVHELGFQTYFGMLNADALIALNNNILRELNSQYRFLKTNNQTDVILVSAKNLKPMLKLVKEYGY